MSRDKCSRLVGEHQEGGLESVLGVVFFPQDPPAHVQDHRPVPLHKRLEGNLVPPGGEALHPLPVREPAHPRTARRRRCRTSVSACSILTGVPRATAWCASPSYCL